MSLQANFGSAANLLQDKAPGLDTGLANVFQLNAANIPSTDIPGARLGLFNLQKSDSVGTFGNANFSANLVQDLQLMNLDQATAAPSFTPEASL